jgi:dTDP-4-amino-4,6-dideoxygalactose transaminase
MSSATPFLDLQAGYLELKAEIDSTITRFLDGGCYILGRELEAFEMEFAHYCESEHAIGVANGLDALQMSLIAMGVGPGDEVIVPSNTFIASWLAISQCGAKPVPVEPNPHTFNLNPNLIEPLITPRTKVIIAVHLYGQAADLDAIHEIAAPHGIKILEDAAQAHGARYNGRRIGGLSDAVAWSFYPGKNLGAFGDGGAVTTNNSELNIKLRTLRNYGSRMKYIHEVRGMNSRLDPLQAAILRVKLRYLDEWNARRSAIADLYLSSILAPRVTLPEIPTWADPVWHLFVIRHPDRDSLQQALLKEGVQTLIHYPLSPYRQSAYGNDFSGVEYPIADSLSGTVLSLPMGPHLTLENAKKVAALINALS